MFLGHQRTFHATHDIHYSPIPQKIPSSSSGLQDNTAGKRGIFQDRIIENTWKKRSVYQIVLDCIWAHGKNLLIDIFENST